MSPFCSKKVANKICSVSQALHVKRVPMFTFGREHEINSAKKWFKTESDGQLMFSVINSIHDLLEGKSTFRTTGAILRKAFAEGDRTTWDKTGGWMLKMGKEYPDIENTWRELASDPNWSVRWRVACHLNHLPDSIIEDLYNLLKNDKSKKVREHAEGNWDYAQNPEKYSNKTIMSPLESAAGTSINYGLEKQAIIHSGPILRR